MPLVTVIIPFYNEEKRLTNAVNSVLNQSYSNIEIVLVNDGSNDDSKKIANNICKENSHCKLITIMNNGPGNARNIGLAKANGKYVTFLDADDELESYAVAILVNSIIQNKVDMSIAMYTMVDVAKKELKKTSWKKANIINEKEAVLAFVKNEITPTVWGKMFKNKFAKQCKFPIKSWKEDDVFILKYLKLCSNISIIDRSIITINCRNNSLTRQVVSSKMIDDISYSYKEQFKLIEPIKELSQELIISQTNTLLILFLILKIDWNSIEDRKNVLKKIQDQVNEVCEKSKKHTINFKRKVLFSLFKSTKYFGWKMPLLVISFLKQKQLKSIRKIKS